MTLRPDRGMRATTSMTKGELVIAFAEYDVAPGYMGAVEFTIPASVTGTF